MTRWRCPPESWCGYCRAFVSGSGMRTLRRASTARFHALKGNILQSLLQFADARDAYAQALDLDPETLHAERNLRLCEKILTDNAGQSAIKLESLIALRSQMTRQQRTAEAIAMATRELAARERQDPKATLDSWKACGRSDSRSQN